MNWQTKAKIQNLVASLPAAVAEPVYYFIQRRFGGLRTINPLDSIRYSVQLATLIMAQDRDIAGKTILELGTGRRLNLPLVFWLCGADRLVTIDLNKYLKEELVIEDLAYIKANTEQISGLFPTFAECPLFQERWALLLEMPPRLSELQKRLNIEYLAPCDARHLPPVIRQQPHIDQASLAALEAGFPIHEKFRNNSHPVNATAGAAFGLAPM